jgi:hypothetical protein
MSKLRISRILVLTLVLLSAPRLRAQEPPPTPPQIDNPDQQDQRIVNGRPGGYFFKRALHPLTWVDVGVLRPAYRTTERDIVPRLTLLKPGPIMIGIGGAGAGSGFGPLVTPLHAKLFGGRLEIETPLLITYKHYEVYQFNVRAPVAEDGPLGVTKVYVTGAYRSRREDKFFGIGNNSRLDNESFFRTVHREAAVGLSSEINKHLTSRIQLGYENVGVTEPNTPQSTQRLFSESDVPGLFTGASLRSTSLLIDHDTKDDEHRATQGGVESAAVSLKEGIGKGDFAYWKYSLDFQRFFPLSQDHRKVIAIRGMAETNQEKGGSRVPFFDMPALGTWGTLRGFENYRFRDKSALAFGLEYRYRIWRALDWGLFVDRGQVAPEPGDFAWNRFHTGYGARLIMLPKPKIPITADIGHSNEKWRMYINFNPRF